MRGLRGLEPMDGVKGRLRPPEKLPRFREGPTVWRKIVGPGEYQGGPGEPPPGFVTSRTSATEWPPYWACCIIFGTPSRNYIRKPPFEGQHGLYWAYQKYVDGGRTRATSADFVFYPSSYCREGIIMRVQTEWHHIFAPTHIQEFDRRQRLTAEKKYRVVDIYDYLWIGDKSGSAVIKYVKLALAGVEPAVLPNSTGHARRSRMR